MNKLTPVSFKDVVIKDGFWKKRIELNENVTIYAVRDRFIETGRFEAFRFNWTEDSSLPKPHLFWDSDVAKWMESVAYILAKKDVPELRQNVEELISLMEENQGEDGYFNIAHTVVHPELRFRIRNNHELYCLGHFIEAAVAWKTTTGCDRLIKVVDKYIDLVIKVFCEEKSAGFVTPGHEEIELALIKLYRLIPDKKYLRLAMFFLEQRGKREEDLADWCNTSYSQSHLPVRELRQATGHAVRAGYLYCAMADAAKETDDSELFEACKALFEDIVNKKMYITGGVGSSHFGEAFTVAYDLPNDTAYAETCASIALMMFADRMKDTDPDSVYADIVEKEIYNGILSGISLDGKAFFYENPLEINVSDRSRHTSMLKVNERLPITRRQEVFNCSCCPPNLTRFFENLPGSIFSASQDAIYLHQFISCEAKIDEAIVSVETQYPVKGKVDVNIINGEGKWIYIRIPSWCKKCDFSAEGEVIKGYKKVYVDSQDFSVSFELDITPRFCSSNPLVRANSGKTAVLSGPVVYCFEKQDNPELEHWTFRLDVDSVPEAVIDDYFGCNVLMADAYSEEITEALYSENCPCTEQKVKVKLIPYFGFANRNECDMAVWLRKK